MLIKVINKLLRFVDIDECSTRDSLPCDANADCINTFGSYNCTCRIGYSGNGTTCTGQYTAFTRLNAAQKIRLLSNSRTLSLGSSGWKRERARGGGHARGLLFARPFSLVPTTSKRLLRRLYHLRRMLRLFEDYKEKLGSALQSTPSSPKHWWWWFILVFSVIEEMWLSSRRPLGAAFNRLIRNL